MVVDLDCQLDWIKKCVGDLWYPVTVSITSTSILDEESRTQGNERKIYRE